MARGYTIIQERIYGDYNMLYIYLTRAVDGCKGSIGVAVVVVIICLLIYYYILLLTLEKMMYIDNYIV